MIDYEAPMQKKSFFLSKASRPKGGRSAIKKCLFFLLLIAVLLAAGPVLRFVSPADESSQAGLPQILPPESRDPETPRTEGPVSVPEPAEILLNSMTVEEKVYQLFVVTPDSLTGQSPETGEDDALYTALTSRPVGGLIFNASHLISREQTAAMLETAQAVSLIPLLTCADEEGGRVTRLMNTLGTTRLDAMFSYRSLGPETAYDNAALIAKDMLSLGFNADLAPVADVWSNPANTVIGDRAYSDNYAQAAELVAAAVRGFREQGLICTLKHFPGHGDTLEDSHYSAAYIHKDPETLHAQEFLPFIAGIEAGADMVMIGHLNVPSLDEVQATFSRKIVTDILREELGFAGVIITDSLSMAAAAGYAQTGEICVQALEAGCDLLLDPDDLDAGVHGVLAALESGRLSEDRLNESVLRILRMKTPLLPPGEE